jgi:uncharacterized membrane protein YhaH (DUF805 family)
MKLFTAKGRASRKEYAKHYVWLVLFFFMGICMTILFNHNPNKEFILPLEQIAFYTLFAFVLCFSIVDIFITIRRLHDLNRSGRQYWLLMIPIYNIYLSLILWFKRGTRGPNRYGPDPLYVNPFSQQTLTESELNRPIG